LAFDDAFFKFLFSKYVYYRFDNANQE